MDLIRNLTVPEKNSMGSPVVLNRHDFTRIKQSARVLSEEEKSMMREEYMERKEAALQQRFEREARLKKLDKQRQTDEKLCHLDVEAKLNAENLLAKAKEKREEDEDRIKYLNEVILEAKCHAIRDAQLQEKKQMQHDVASEEMRLDEMMEIDRKNAIRVQEEIENRRKQELRLGAVKLREQITEMEERKLRLTEAKERETEKLKKEIEQMVREDEVIALKKKQKQIALRDELLEACQRMSEMKVQKQRQEKLEEKNVLEFHKEKALIEDAKSHATHDLQVKEKQVIEQQHVAEEKRLRKLMEDDCEVNLKYQDNVVKQRKKLRQLIAEDIRKQITEREWEKLMKLEAKEQENAKMLRYFEDMIAEDVRIEEEKKRRQKAVFVRLLSPLFVLYFFLWSSFISLGLQRSLGHITLIGFGQYRPRSCLI
uniref:Cilia- and flagella-associated protein 45 n=1 Tax=Octopus bimaculoides TaxID=37653 RepID=A0A0L8G182_OCTBM